MEGTKTMVSKGKNRAKGRKANTSTSHQYIYLPDSNHGVSRSSVWMQTFQIPYQFFVFCVCWLLKRWRGHNPNGANGFFLSFFMCRKGDMHLFYCF